MYFSMQLVQCTHFSFRVNTFLQIVYICEICRYYICALFRNLHLFIFYFFFFKIHFPTLLFTILPKFYNFHENRIFFTNLYFYTEYAILVNPNIKASLLQMGTKKQKQSPISIYHTINKMMSQHNTVSITLQVPFFPISNDYVSKATVLVEHRCSFPIILHTFWSSPRAAQPMDYP